ncbi:MAG: Fic family protein [Planctomycetaceae bacterium]|nr:Fic family protein [Planctomycetaceae bacterium]
MSRETGKYVTREFAGERVNAFVPYPLPPANPVFCLEGILCDLHSTAIAAIGRLEIAGSMVPSPDWFLYGFVRKEAVVSSQIEGTQATLEDVVAWEATRQSDRTADVEEICNCVDALTFARAEIEKPDGLPLCVRLLCAVHQRLMRGARGSDKQPGMVRTSQNWIGGTRPGTARFVPPPPDEVPDCLSALEQWIHSGDSLPPLVRAGLAHVQFETIHPFLDGSGRIGRLLITLLVEQWGLLSSPLLYVSLGFKRHQQEYYERLSRVRTHGDWEGWIEFFLRCVIESADDGVTTAQRLFQVVGEDRLKAIQHQSATVNSLRLFELLPQHPVVTLARAGELLAATKPTTQKAIDSLCAARVLHEVTGRKRDRAYAWQSYIDVLGTDTMPIPR